MVLSRNNNEAQDPRIVFIRHRTDAIDKLSNSAATCSLQSDNKCESLL